MTPPRAPPVSSLSISLPEWVDGEVDWDRAYAGDDERMALAIRLSRLNVEKETGGPFGCAIFDAATGGLLGVGVNQVVASCNSLLHGEIMAIMCSQRRVGSYSLGLPGGARRELFTSCEPCAMCLGAIFWSGVSRLVCAATGDDARAIGFDEGPVFDASYAYLRERGIEITRGLQRDAARQVLLDYAARGGLLYNGRVPAP